VRRWPGSDIGTWQPSIAEVGPPPPPPAVNAPSELADAIARRGLGRVRTVARVRRGSVGHVLRIEADRVVYAKIHAAARLPHLGLGHRLSRIAREAGIPAVVAIETADGEAFSPAGERVVSVYPEAPGSPRRRHALTLPLAYACGSLLGRTHRALESEPRPGWLSGDGLPTPAEVIERLEALLPQVRDRRALRDVEWRLPQLEAATPLEPCAAGGCQLVHGDIQDSNLLFDNRGNVTALLDWEQPSWRGRAIDLMRLLDFSRLLDRPRWAAAAIAGYRSVVPVASEVLEEAATWWHQRRLLDVWLLEEAHLRGNTRVLRLLPEAPASVTSRWAPVASLLA
jgi:Ser/Thr protein kinase RdoA (MazF antagonist)